MDVIGPLILVVIAFVLVVWSDEIARWISAFLQSLVERRPKAPGVPVPEDPPETLWGAHAAIVATLPDSIRADFMPPSVEKFAAVAGGYIAPSPVPWAPGWTPIYQADRVRRAKEAHHRIVQDHCETCSDAAKQAWNQECDWCPDCCDSRCTGCLGRG